jgi:hypothetical protein
VYAIEVEGVRPQRATRRVLALALGCAVEDIFPPNESTPGAQSRGPMKVSDAAARPIAS